MNLRHFSMALLISALPLSLSAEQASKFNEGDFKVVEKQADGVEPELKVKLSKSGKAKLKRLQHQNN